MGFALRGAVVFWRTSGSVISAGLPTLHLVSPGRLRNSRYREGGATGGGGFPERADLRVTCSGGGGRILRERSSRRREGLVAL